MVMRIEIRDDCIMIDGYVNAVERESKVLRNRSGTFVEKIKAGAFGRALDRAKRTSSEVRVLLNHNYERELTSTKDATTKIFEDAIGSYMKRGRPETTKGKAEARRDYEHYALHGGMPETFHMIDARGYLRDIYNAILFRDILKRHKLRNPQTLSDISRVLMESYALEVSYANIANRLGIKSVHTVQTYANYLESAYLIQTVNRFSFKAAERLKLGKVYCIDPGFVSYASGVLEGAENRGRRLENIVFLQLRSLREKLDYEIYYYRDQSHEVDFVLRHFGKVKRLVQVCWDISDEKTRKRELSALFEVGRKLKCADLILVTDHEDEIVNEGSETVRVVNVVDWLLAAPSEETPNWGQCASAETGVKTWMP